MDGLTPFRVFRYADFRRLWVGLTISASGTTLRNLSASILIYQQTRSAAWVGLLNFLGFLPLVFLSLVGGAAVDRRGSRRILVAAQVASIVIAAALAASAAAHLATPVVLCGALFLLGCAYSFTKPAAQAMIPALVPAQALTNAIAVNGLQFTLGLVLGPVTASVLLTLVGFPLAFLLDGITFGVLLLAALRLPDERRTVPGPADLTGRQGIGEAIRFVRRDALLLALLGGIVCGTAAIEVVKSLMPVFAVTSMHRAATASGFLVGAFGLGTLLGVVALGSVRCRVGLKGSIALGLAVLGGAMMSFSMTPILWVAVPLLTLAGAGHMLSFTVMTSTVFQLVPKQLRGRVLAIHALSFLGVSPFTALGAGLLAAAAGVRVAGVLAGAVGLAGAAVLAVLLSRPDARKALDRVGGVVTISPVEPFHA